MEVSSGYSRGIGIMLKWNFSSWWHISQQGPTAIQMQTLKEEGCWIYRYRYAYIQGENEALMYINIIWNRVVPVRYAQQFLLLQ